MPFYSNLERLFLILIPTLRISHASLEKCENVEQIRISVHFKVQMKFLTLNDLLEFLRSIWQKYLATIIKMIKKIIEKLIPSKTLQHEVNPNTKNKLH